MLSNVRAGVTGNRITLTSKFCSPLHWDRRKHILDKVTQVHHWHWVLQHFDPIIRTAIGEKMPLTEGSQAFQFLCYSGTVRNYSDQVVQTRLLPLWKIELVLINTGVQFLLNHSNVIFICFLNKCNKLQMRSPASHMVSYSLLGATLNTFSFNESQRFLWHSTATRRAVS